MRDRWAVAPYSKREMARDMVELMHKFGHGSFAVVGHDRGARVAHRMALDFPAYVRHLAVLDILPTEVKVRTRFRAVNGVREQPRTPPNAERSNRVFAGIDADGPIAVLDVADQLRPLLAQIGQPLAEQALRHDAGRLLERKCMDDVEYADAVSSPQTLSSFGRPRFGTRLGGQPSNSYQFYFA
ncbi:alpha/beta hydrolase [Burkholderia metallica]|nr:alpha/beta hydrolase [Burkholderia metallica]